MKLYQMMSDNRDNQDEFTNIWGSLLSKYHLEWGSWEGKVMLLWSNKSGITIIILYELYNINLYSQAF